MPKHTILIVDDEPNILNSLKRLLHSEDLEILTAGTADEGLERLKERQGVDLIISDNRLPDLSGIDFFVKVRQLYPNTIRILITGYPDLDSAILAINKGQVYRYIPKPWDIEELRLIVMQGLEYYDVLRDNRTLLKIAKQQAEWMNTLTMKYPQLTPTELDKRSIYIIDEKNVSETLAEFMKKYYPKV